MSIPDLRQGVFDLLQNFRGPNPLKNLFWTELNYDRANTPLSRRGWPAPAHDALAEDPLLFGTAGADGAQPGGSQIDLWDADETADILDLNEAEEILRLMRSEDPAEYDRIAALRDGIRSAKPATDKGTFVFCQAGRYQQLFLLDEAGEVISRDVPRILGAVRCDPELQIASLPADYNATVMRVKRRFIEEVKHR